MDGRLDVRLLDLPWRAKAEPSWAGRAATSLAAAIRLLPRAPDILVAHSLAANAILDHVAVDLADRGSSPRGLVLIEATYHGGRFAYPMPGTESPAEVEGLLRLWIDERVRLHLGPRAADVSPRAREAMASRVLRGIPRQAGRALVAELRRTAMIGVAAVSSPVALVGGSKDRSSPRAGIDYLHADLPDASKHILAGAGHFGHVERPAEVADVVLALHARLHPSGREPAGLEVPHSSATWRKGRAVLHDNVGPVSGMATDSVETAIVRGSDFDPVGIVRGPDDIARYVSRPPTLVAMLRASVERAGSADAVIEVDGPRLTYQQLWDGAATVAGGLRSRGVRPGDRVALRLPAGAEWCVAFLTSLFVGAAAVPLNTRLTAAELDEL